MNYITNLTNSTNFILDYRLSNEMSAYEKDGQQLFGITFIALQRIYNLFGDAPDIAQLNFPYKQIMLIPIGLGLLTAICSRSEDSTVSAKIGHISGKILERSKTLIDISACVYYIALIHFGFPFEGTIGLCVIAAVALKSYNHLPFIVDRFLRNLSHLTDLFLLVQPTKDSLDLAFKLILVSDLIDFTLKSSFVRQFTGDAINNPMPGRHIYPEKRIEEVAKAINSTFPFHYNFSVNPSYIYADEVGQVFSKEILEEISKTSAAELFKEFEDKIRERNVTLTDDEVNGLNLLKKGVIDGKTSDYLPGNVEEFERVMKATIKTIMDDEAYFEVKAKALAELGNNCAEGWTRDCTFLLNPKSKDYKWAVHQILAKFRGEQIKEILRKKGSFKLGGGNNNVHLTNVVQAASNHRFRTFEGVLFEKQSHPTLINSLFVNKILPQAGQRPTYLEGHYFRMYTTLYNPGMFSNLLDIRDLVRYENESFFDPEKLINCVHEAIKPTYEQITQKSPDGKLLYKNEIRRVIEWEGIQGWMADFNSRYEFGDVEFYLNPDFVVQDELMQFYLTEKGVALLLWDMGIISTNSKMDIGISSVSKVITG